ncbi:aminotransferase [Corynebacterium sp. HMSC08C04]|uniref:MalY/PatB family protein n=1 Tax=unclassified Corynebacterium TaxID=2624378 RepID=UPI0008A4E0EF|nr:MULTISPECIES: aminotransferase class I/II-fold pyridoxal phosphate-dependent enzyme [unclassified Corynebacterium]OFR38680.1 aminotransferase [Corynebacterium sp. HMSC077D03]OFT34746.1 aminotransferase [Corynebacterium sp. HMSC08C04]OHO69701.1 aminotransferase [Corynebacterium sp. HMSC036D03]
MQFPSLEKLQARGTRKWTVYGDDVLPLWIAESDFETSPAVKDAIQRAVDAEAFGYTPSPKSAGLNDAVADFYGTRYGWRPNPRQIFWIGDVVRGLFLALNYFTRPDSPVVVPVPSYPPLLELPEAAGREKIETTLDLADIERAFQQGAGSILLANPFNPLGTVFEEDYLTKLVALAEKYDARILADEIHAPLVYEGKHIPVASLGEAGARRTITVTATSKAWNIAGLKCAQIIFSNAGDVATWNSLSGVAKDGTGTLGVLAAEAAYRDYEFLNQEIEYLRQTRDWLVEELPKHIPGLKTTVPQATYLLWLDFRDTAIGDNPQPAKWLRENAKVALNEGETFGTGGSHHARLNFATSREILEEALDRLEKVF